MKGMQKCTCAGASLIGRNSVPLYCIRLDTATGFACGTGHLLTEYMDRVQSIIEHQIDINKAKPIACKKL